MLSAIGEAHSAHNTTLLLQQRDVNATFVDLTGWREIENPTFEERIRQSFARVDVENELPMNTWRNKPVKRIKIHNIAPWSITST